MERRCPVTVLTAVSTGLAAASINYGWGVLVGPVNNDHKEWLRADLNIAFSLAEMSGCLWAPIAGMLMDKFGPRKMITGSLISIAAGYLLISFATELWHFYVAFAIAGVGLPGIFPLGMGKIMANWWANANPVPGQMSLGLVSGLVSAGNNIGGLTVTSAGTWIVTTYCWHAMAGTLATCLVVVATLDWFILLDKPELERNNERREQETELAEANPAQSPPSFHYRREAFCKPTFYSTCIGLMCAYWTYAGVVTQLNPSLLDEGFKKTRAAGVVSTAALLAAGSKIGSGWLSGKITGRLTLVLIMFVEASALTLFYFNESGPESHMVTTCCILLYGTSFGGVGVLLSVTGTETFGKTHYGKIMGLIYLTFLCPGLIGPWLAGKSHDMNGNHRFAFLVAAVVFVVGAILLLINRGQPAPQEDARQQPLPAATSFVSNALSDNGSLIEKMGSSFEEVSFTGHNH